MSKVKMGPVIAGFEAPMLSPIIGANVDGKPNFMSHAYRGRFNHPPELMVGLAVERRRYTHKGITQNMTFSVNLTTPSIARETDYCGSVSGANVPNKAETCGFKVFYGKLGTAPLIEECPVNMECSVAHILDLGTHSLFVGRVEETHISEDCLTDGKPDINKIKPLFFTRVQRTGHKTYDHLYLSIGIHPDDPEALAEIVGATIVEHAGDWIHRSQPVDVYGMERDILKPTSKQE